MSTHKHWFWPSFARRTRRSARYIALTVAGSFIVMGLAWVLLTDILLYNLTQDRILIARIETAKGWTFVALACILLYIVTLRSALRINQAHVVIFTIVDSIADAVILIGQDRAIMHANPAALRMLRCKDVHDLAQMRPIEFSRRYRVSYPDGSLVPPDQFLAMRAFDEGGPLHYKVVLHPPGGAELVVSTTAAGVRREVDEPAELVVSVLHDITESEHLEALRDQFFAAAAHSLKTPVAIIKANLQVLSSGAAPQLRRATAAVDRQCDRIDRLVQNLLVLARARSRTLQLYPKEVELGPMVERIMREMAVMSPDREVRIELVDSPRVYADQERLATALRNLIDEACRSSTPGSPLTVQLRLRDQDAVISVRYQPLSPEHQVYEVGEYDDRGISRCVAKIIVEAHGGALGEETVGAEATRWIRLPAITGGHE
jgi:signal transduction histidine kinase